MNVYAIYDDKAEAYLQPWFAVNNAVALRNFQQAANDQSSQFNKHATDYTLFQIGEFDETTGRITPLETLKALGGAWEYVKDE